MNEQDQILADALRKTVAIVDNVEERYRNVAFPVILEALIKTTSVVRANSIPIRVDDKHSLTDLRLSSSVSANEFFRKAAPDSHPGRFVCAAYYLLHTGKAEQFTQADILEIYGKLREPKPKNPADVMNQCIRKAHIIDADASTKGQKSWVITPSGEKYVEDLLNGNTTGNK